MPQFESLEISQTDEIATITINRPQTLNALSQQLIRELTAAFSEIKSSSKIRVIVLTGAGGKAFVAGADISEMRNMDPNQAREFSVNGQKLSLLMEALPQIIVARVQGYALGGGCELAMSCDVIIATKDSKFGQPEVNLGLIPGFGGTQRLVRRVGLPMALDMLCAGRNLSGDEAFQLGLISRVCTAEELDAEVSKTIKKILKGAPDAIAQTKKLTRKAYEMNLESGLKVEADTFAACFTGKEAKEGLNAFLEKRSASFSR